MTARDIDLKLIHYYTLSQDTVNNLTVSIMWPFNRSKTTLADSGMFRGFTDWHSHILPGVDDGVQTLEDSLKILRHYEELGFRKVWLTPHIMEDYPNTPEELRARFAELSAAWDGSVELALAAENMLDNLFDERLDAGELLPLGKGGNHLLVETSYFTPPMDLDGILEKIMKKGFFPVLAHPERYRYMEESDYESLKERGILFQTNFVSLVGGYGETARKKAEWLIDKGMIDMAGSDVHRLATILKAQDTAPSKKKYAEAIAEIAHNAPEI